MLLPGSLLLLLLGLLPTPSFTSGEGELCTVCIDLVTTLEEWITDETTTDEIIDFVESFCKNLGILQVRET